MINQMSYNFIVKVSGKTVILKKYSQSRYFNYSSKNISIGGKGESSNTLNNFLRSTIRARQNVFDIISCNVNVIHDYNGKIQLPKFLTLTFKDNITDVSVANKEFTNFNKRLSYHLFKTNKNVLKYLCVPEFQKRGAIHYHVVYFNLPFTKFEEIKDVWGNGSIFIEGVKDNIEDYAKYVAKYINKTNSQGEENFEVYTEKGLLNQKRYFCSRGLNRPDVYKLSVNEKLYNALKTLLNQFHIDEYEYNNEFIGNVKQNTYEINNLKAKRILMNSINTIFDIMKDIYNKPLHYRENLYKIIKRNVIEGFHEIEFDDYLKYVYGVS